MSLEHFPNRQKKSGSATLEPLFTREELAARWRCKPQHITRNYQRLGLHPIKVGKRQLFTESNIVEVEHNATCASR